MNKYRITKAIMIMEVLFEYKVLLSMISRQAVFRSHWMWLLGQ